MKHPSCPDCGQELVEYNGEYLCLDCMHIVTRAELNLLLVGNVLAGVIATVFGIGFIAWVMS